MPTFGLLESTPEERRRRWRSFGMGTVLQLSGVALILWLAIVLPPAVTRDLETNRLSIAHIVLYNPVLPKPAPIPPPPRQVAKVEPAPKPVEMPKPVEPKPVPAPVMPKLVATPRVPVPVAPKLQAVEQARLDRPTLPKFEPKVQVNAFAGATPAEAKLKLPAAKVQTGGFGSKSGLPGDSAVAHGNVAHLGAFDMPAGPGKGNGTAGSHSTPGVVASAGFGNGTAGAPPSAGTGSGGTVQSAGFSDAQALNQSAAAPAQAHSAAPAYDPVEVTSKPNPVYSAEGRRLHIQGEVLLRVVFEASGRLQILGVTRGLGHGLDEAAVQAAQQIQFKPARRNGQPVDTTATLHILFQLAQ